MGAGLEPRGRRRGGRAAAPGSAEAGDAVLVIAGGEHHEGLLREREAGLPVRDVSGGEDSTGAQLKLGEEEDGTPPERSSFGETKNGDFPMRSTSVARFTDR